MNLGDIWNGIKSFFGGESSEAEGGNVAEPVDPRAHATMSNHGVVTPIYSGEENWGELGPARDYYLDHYTLRTRGWQFYLDSDLTHTIVKKFALWVVGSGLRIQAEPMTEILSENGVSLDDGAFKSNVEKRFRMWAGSKRSSYSRMETLDELSFRAQLSALVGGDCLVILRVRNGRVRVQVVDGSRVRSPMGHRISRPNKIDHGVELDSKGQHVAYWVRERSDNYGWKSKRIPASGGRRNMTMAFMVYGLKYRTDDNRGIPITTPVMETIGKIDRYKEATVGSAEERQKVPFTIEHEEHSTGENPAAEQIAKAMDADSDNGTGPPKDHQGDELANRVAATTNKSVFNMPIGAQMKQLASTNEINFNNFYDAVRELVSATIGMPPEVALSKYDSNFSASRAALKDWEHTLNVNRYGFGVQFYQPIYDLWLTNEVLNGRIQAPQYLTAFQNDDEEVLDAYRNARFEGQSVPHIDPVKEVNAERAKLGPKGADLPLTTYERAVKAVNAGESDENMKKFVEEIERWRERSPEDPEENSE